jgi:hypothetical protein
MTRNPPKIIGKLIFSGSVLLIIYAFFNSIVIDAMLRRSGKCIQANIYRETLGGKTRQALEYRFFLNGNAYHGLAKEDGIIKIGDNICIVYLENFPNKNRPIKYFSEGEIKCNCKQYQ